MCQSLGSVMGGGGGVRDFRSTSKQELGGGGAEPRLSRMYLTNTDDIDDFRAHIFCLQKTEEKRSTMKQGHLNNCQLMHCRKLITDTQYTVKIACANELCKGHFGKFE